MEKNYLDKTISLTERKKIYKETMESRLNPFATFDPDNFEPLASPEEAEVAYRKRVKPPTELPLFSLKPKEIMEGQMIGMFESKQDIYLIFAHRCNEMQKEIDELKETIKKLTQKQNN